MSVIFNLQEHVSLEFLKTYILNIVNVFLKTSETGEKVKNNSSPITIGW